MKMSELVQQNVPGGTNARNTNRPIISIRRYMPANYNRGTYTAQSLYIISPKLVWSE